MADDSLTPEEQAAIAGLPREAAVPPNLEDRVVGELRRARLIRRSTWPRVAGNLAAALVLFAAGLGAGALIVRDSPSRGPRFLLLLYGAPPSSAIEAAARVTEYAEWARQERAAGHLLGGEELGTSRAAFGSASVAPPEAGDPSGFFLIAASSMHDAQVIAARCPHLRHGGAAVLRAIEDTR